MQSVKACHCCGMVHWIPRLAIGQSAACTRCHTTIERFGKGIKRSTLTAAASLAAFFLYWPAILLPIVEIEQLGHRHHSGLLMGTMDLIRHGSWFVGIVVLLFSIVFPLVKIVLLLELSLLGLLHRKHRAVTYRAMESAGRWSMMDVMLLAFLVMLVKLGELASFQVGPAVFAFVGCVVMSMLASLWFDPHAIWEDAT